MFPKVDYVSRNRSPYISVHDHTRRWGRRVDCQQSLFSQSTGKLIALVSERIATRRLAKESSSCSQNRARRLCYRAELYFKLFAPSLVTRLLVGPHFGARARVFRRNRQDLETTRSLRLIRDCSQSNQSLTAE